MTLLTIEQAKTEIDIENTRTLFREYETWLGFSLCFQGFDDELANLPGKYSAPEGRLLLATFGGDLAGCVAMRKLADGICEMKRLFVRENFRGHGIGVQLLERIISEAKLAGYRRIRLDTYPVKMGKAVTLYENHGFSPIEPYYENPHDDILFMEKVL